MHVQLSRYFTQHTSDFVLQIKLVVALGLVRKHELHVIDTDQPNVMCINCVFKRRKHFLHTCTSVKVHKVKWHLLEVF